MPSMTTAPSQAAFPQASNSQMPQNNFFPMQNVSSSFYYPYYYPQTVGYTMPPPTFTQPAQTAQTAQQTQQMQQMQPAQQQQQLYNQMMANMSNPAFMSQFAQFMSMMNSGALPPSQPTPPVL